MAKRHCFDDELLLVCLLELRATTQLPSNHQLHSPLRDCTVLSLADICVCVHRSAATATSLLSFCWACQGASAVCSQTPLDVRLLIRKLAPPLCLTAQQTQTETAR